MSRRYFQPCYLFMAIIVIFFFLLLFRQTVYAKVVVIDCNSNSMGMAMDCNDKTLNTVVHRWDWLYEGDVYIYKEPINETDYDLIVHRLIYKINDTHLVFKGDNNKRGELVRRKNVMYHVEGVEYR